MFRNLCIGIFCIFVLTAGPIDAKLGGSLSIGRESEARGGAVHVQNGETFKKALIGGALGAAGGILTYEAGKTIIKSVTEPIRYNERNYHFDNHGGQMEPEEFQCQMPWSQFIEPEPTTISAPDALIQILSEAELNATVVEDVSLQNLTTPTPSPDEVLQSIQYADGSRPKTIVWTCKEDSEVCCGTDCCPIPMEKHDFLLRIRSNSVFGDFLLIIFFLLILSCCCKYCCPGATRRFCRSVIFCYGDDDKQQGNHDVEQKA